MIESRCAVCGEIRVLHVESKNNVCKSCTRIRTARIKRIRRISCLYTEVNDIIGLLDKYIEGSTLEKKIIVNKINNLKDYMLMRANELTLEMINEHKKVN